MSEIHASAIAGPIRSQVLAALAGGADSVGAICAETQLQDRQVSNALNQLKRAGSVQRADGHWALAATDAPAEEQQVEAEAAPRTRKRRKTRRARRVSRGAAAVVAAERELFYLIDEDSDLQIMRADGSGETAIVRRVEIARLFDFLQRTRAVWQEPQ